MATTVNCDICKKQIEGPTTIIIDGGVYTVRVSQFNIPAGRKKIDDICERCLFNRAASHAAAGAIEQGQVKC